MNVHKDFEWAYNAGLYQSEVAQLLSVSRVTVNMWYSGKSKPRPAKANIIRGYKLLTSKAVEAGLLPLSPSVIEAKARMDEIKRVLKGVRDSLSA